MDYKIVHKEEDIIARVCHPCSKIVLGNGFRQLIEPLKHFVLAHEVAHSKGIGSEEKADEVAFRAMEKKGYSRDYIKKLLLNHKLRTKAELL